MPFDFSQIQNGSIIRLESDTNRDWVCIHHSKCDLSWRKTLKKNNKNQTGFYLFGGLWSEGDPLTGDPYGKCIEHLERGMSENIEGVVGHISTDYEEYRNFERINKKYE